MQRFTEVINRDHAEISIKKIEVFYIYLEIVKVL